ERIELAGMDPARHQIVARAFGAGGGQDRRLELGEALLDHPPADRCDHLAAQQDVRVQPITPEVEIAIFEPDILGIVGLAGDRQRQLLGSRLDGRTVGDDLDRAGRKVGIGRLGPARDDLAVACDDRFGPQPLEQGERLAVRAGDDLGQAVMIAQVDEQDAAMIALAVNPAREADAAADIGLAKLAAIVGAIDVHGAPTGAGQPLVKRAMPPAMADQRLLPPPPWLCSPPLRPASEARSGSFLKLPPLAWPPLLAISRWRSSSIEAKPRFELPPRLLLLSGMFMAPV